MELNRGGIVPEVAGIGRRLGVVLVSLWKPVSENNRIGAAGTKLRADLLDRFFLFEVDFIPIFRGLGGW